VGYLAYHHILRPCLVSNPPLWKSNNAEDPRLVIAVTFFIYIRAGNTIYQKRRELDDFNSTDRDLTYGADNLGTIKTTEVSVTTEAMPPTAIHLQPMSPQAPDPSDSNSNGVYSVHISAHGNPGDIADEGAPIERQQTRVRVAAPQQRSGGNPGRRQNRELNNAAWQYTKCALLFFTAILITWVPSSANRVYSVLHTKSTSVPLEFMSAFVLPLQGFWNALIYMVTSWSACKNLFTDLRQSRRPHLTELMDGMAPDIGGNHNHRRHNLPQFRANTTSNKFETESMTELANESRPTSDDGRQDHIHA
jgi:hypothetical protein